MRAKIIHADGRCTDLAGVVDAATYAELEHTKSPQRSPALWCGSCGGGVYIRHGSVQRDVLFGAHHKAENCDATFVIRKATLSDEHKRQAEYHAIAAQRAGHSADFEVVTTGHTRVDVVIDDAIGIEVQRSALTKAAAVDRTARSVAAGLHSVTWFTDRTTNPQWTGHVPGYRAGTAPADWKVLPSPGTATAAGLQLIEAVRCGYRAPCPHPRGSCTGFAPWLSAWTGLYVDDVVAGLAAGMIRPVHYPDGHVRLLSADSIRLYEELAGRPLTYRPGTPKGRLLLPASRQECERATLISNPAALPAPVRERLAAETDRAQQHREAYERARIEQIAAEAARERERQEINRSYERMAEERRQRLHEEQQDRLQRERERREQEQRDLAAYGVPCAVFKCGEPGRLYPNGSHVPIARCSRHEPHHMWVGANGRVVTGEPLKPIPLASLPTGKEV